MTVGWSKRGATNRYVTTCKSCGFGIFEGQAYRWQGGSNTGMVHQDCHAPPPAPPSRTRR